MIKIHFTNFPSTNRKGGLSKDGPHGYVLYVVTLGLPFSLI